MAHIWKMLHTAPRCCKDAVQERTSKQRNSQVFGQRGEPMRARGAARGGLHGAVRAAL
jgi:hypothetical protein